MKAVYFAWVWERVGKTEEDLVLPPGVDTVSDLIGWLKGRGENYAHAFENAGSVRAALDRRHVKHDVAVAGAHEVAFFPPMTGG